MTITKVDNALEYIMLIFNEIRDGRLDSGRLASSYLSLTIFMYNTMESSDANKNESDILLSAKCVNVFKDFFDAILHNSGDYIKDKFAELTTGEKGMNTRKFVIKNREFFMLLPEFLNAYDAIYHNYGFREAGLKIIDDLRTMRLSVKDFCKRLLSIIDRSDIC